MSLAEDLDLADYDPHRDGGKHAVDRRWPCGLTVARAVARYRRDHGPLPANPVRGRWAE